MNVLVKRIFVLALLTITSVQAVTRSHTFYSLRPNFQSAMPERVSLFRNELLDECQGFGGAVEFVPYAGNTTQAGRGQMARFFLPPGCITNALRVREFNPERELNTANTDDGNPLKDLEARHFNIRTVNETFSSTITIAPEQSVLGLGIAYKQTLSAKSDGTPGFWIEISLPIERVENRLNLHETIENDGGGPRQEVGLNMVPRQANMVDALNQESWHYGRISKKKLSHWGLADVELKFGYNSYDCDAYSIATYGTIIIPTGDKVRGKTMFEPIIGNNRHFGFSLGSSYAYQMWCKNRYTIDMYLDNNTRYLFSNTQIRSFDLIGKPWSRYMEVYATSEEAAQAARTNDSNSGSSGINVFTHCVRVSPYLAGSFNTAFVLSSNSDCASWQLEGGYNLFIRQSESVDLECSNRISRAALKAVDGQGRTTLARTIKDNFKNSEFSLEERYAAISNCDIDFESITHPATIANTIYASLGYRWETECPCVCALGGSYEFTTNEINAAPDRWLLWGKIILTF